MANVFNNQNYNSIPASNYNLNTANSSNTQLTTWNNILISATKIADSVSSGFLRSQFINPNGSIVVNTSTGSILMDGILTTGNIVNFSKLVVSNSDSSIIATIEGSISLNTSTSEYSGNYTSLKYEANQKGTTPYGYTVSGNILVNSNITSGSAYLIEYYTKNNTLKQVTRTSYSLESSLVGIDYLNDSLVLSNGTNISNISSMTYDFSNNLIGSISYTNQKTISANTVNIYTNLLAEDDIIIASGDSSRILPSGYGGNDSITGDSGNNYIVNKVDGSNLIYNGLGNDSIDGAGGYDTVFMGSNKSIGSYSFQKYNAINKSFTIIDNSLTDNTGIDYIINIEEIQFSDFALIFNIFSNYFELISSNNSNSGVFRFGAASADNLNGTIRNDAIYGNGGNDSLFGNEGNDLITGGVGNDTIDGGGGIDTATYSANAASYTLSSLNLTTRISINGSDGTDSLINIERIQFKDKTLALDIGPGQNAGQVYRLYQAAFARTPDTPGVKYHLNDMEANGLALWNISSNFLASPEFSAKYGSNPTDTQYINALYKNVLNRTPAASEVAWYKDQFDSKKMDHQAALIGFSESPENVALVGVAISNGILLG